MKLTHLTDKQLFIDTENLVTKERVTLSQILYHLKEIDSRKLYADYKCSSLFEFCVKILKYSEGAAGRRIQAMRLIKEVPELIGKIQDGSLSLTNIGIIASETKHAINKAQAVIDLSNKLSNTSSRKALEIINQDKPEIRSITIATPVSKSQTKINMIIKNETFEKIQKLKNLLSNRNMNSIEEVINFAISKAIELEEKKFEIKPQKTSIISSKRTPAVALKREVYKRDQYKCINCGSTHKLNLDHKIPYALGGKTTLANLRVLCFNCNQRARIMMKL